MANYKAPPEEQKQPEHQYIVKTDEELVDVWADEVDVVESSLVFYRRIPTVRTNRFLPFDRIRGAERLLVAYFQPTQYEYFIEVGTAYGGIDPRAF